MSFWLYNGDCLDVLRGWPDCSIDSVVTDPPYEFGYMAKSWDRTGIANSVEFWREVLRILKPGAHLLSFGGSRTYHRMASAVEDAEFEIRDSLHWFYFNGFPKSQDAAREYDMYMCQMPGRHYDKNLPQGAKSRPGDHLCWPHSGREPYVGQRTALKPAHEPIVLARKSLEGTLIQNLVQWGTGALSVDACRIGSDPVTTHSRGSASSFPKRSGETTIEESGRNIDQRLGLDTKTERTGRWPANVILDEHAAAELDAITAYLRPGGSLKGGERRERSVVSSLALGPRGEWQSYGDSGGASRFFYVPKPGRKERDMGCQYLPLRSAADLTEREPDTDGLGSPRAGAGRTSKGAANTHPTVKPVALMEYLCRLVTPPGGVVLDPFTGSGTTGIGARRAGLRFVGIEKELEYVAIANARIHAALTHEVEDEEDPDHSAVGSTAA